MITSEPSAAAPPLSTAAPFAPDGAPLAPLLLAQDWSRSPLGDPRTWPEPLRLSATLLLDSAAPAWLAWGEDLALVYNDACARSLGERHPQALGAPLAQAWAGCWRQLGPIVDQVMAGRAVHRREDAGGIVGAFAPLRDVRGRIQGLICTGWSVAGELHEAAERYRLARLATNDAIWDWRIADGHVIWNQALHSLFGHALDKTSASWWIEHIHPDDRARIDADIHAVIEGGGTSWVGEYRFRRADGSYAEIYDRGTVLRDAEGRALRMIGAMLDLSERIAIGAALRESERLFRTLFESIDEGFCVIEFLDGPHGPLSDYVHVMANPAYAANAGIENVVGQRVRDMVPLEADGWVEIYRRVLLTGEPVRFERTLERTGRYLELAALRIEPPERRQVAVLFQDGSKRHQAELALRELNDTLERRVAEGVDERVRIEGALRQAQKMEAVGQLTGGIAHDFNNMLAVVTSALELLGRRVQGGIAPMDARALQYVEMAKGGGRRAAQLTQRLLAFSRQQALRPETLSLNRLVANMSELLQHALGGNVRLDTVLAGGLWHAHVDANQLESAILNLAVNARDAMPGGGRLRIETANAPLDEAYASAHPGLIPGQYVVVAVGDTGTGMSPEVVARAFDPFFTTKEVGRGTGLGLSQVYGFVQQSGGHVKIESAPGQGTTVRLYLPRHHEAAEALPAAAAAEVVFGDAGDVILVVEDEAAVRTLSAAMLAELGYRVLEADGADAALALLDSHPEIALLFTDVVMPEMNGRELADLALRRRPGLPVLFTTGYTRNAVVHKGVLEAGVQLIGKPFTLEQLAPRVRALLDRRVTS
ncbi:hypothetical protein MasN3_24530 [Massilia varians]|uniref:histidine kinase n=1 Tax=Massilia varians TaxID=457921 RepID=A0ABM8C6T4_9BURK|nr:ATP-binding protein [Massilia varians]BDT58959.1 hypothetical protein MasN3_24530 [Massilia varians]